MDMGIPLFVVGLVAIWFCKQKWNWPWPAVIAGSMLHAVANGTFIESGTSMLVDLFLSGLRALIEALKGLNPGNGAAAGLALDAMTVLGVIG